jgi:hypothetical protein
VTLARQAMWVLNNITSGQGGSHVCRLCGAQPATAAPQERAMSVTELADYVDLTPWHRFEFTASNAAILRAVDGSDAVC